MKMISGIPALCLACGLSLASTQTQQPDVIGIYADLAGENADADIAAGAPLDLHLLILNPQPCYPGGGGWGWHCHIESTPNVTFTQWMIPGSGFNIEEPPTFMVWYCGQLFPVDDNPVLLLSMRMVCSDGNPGAIYVESKNPYIDVPFYDIDDGFSIPTCGRTLTPSSGSTERPVFCVNGGPPSSTENGTWGRVKQLYR